MNHAEADSGFSLIELVIVVAILGIITAIAVATYVFSLSHSRSIVCEANQQVLTRAAVVYAAQHGGPPDELEDLRTYVTGFDHVILCPSDHTVTLEWDATTEEVECPLHP